MAEEGKGVALAILGIVAVIAVVGLILLFTGATGNASMGISKTYGGVNRYEDFPYLVDRTTGGMASTAGNPDAIYYPEGFYDSESAPMIQQQADAGFYGETVGYQSRTQNRQPYYVPSGQFCASDNSPGFRCANGATCIEDMGEAESGNWVAAPAHPCYMRASQY
jgi:hypothetical protein